MASYYHEARAQARALKDRTTANKARSERRLTDEEAQLEEQLAFESYRDVIRWACQGLAPHEGLAHAAQEDVAIRTAQRRAALGLAAGMRGGGGPAGRDPGYAAGGLGHDAPTDGDRVSASEGSGDEGGGEDPGADVRMDALARAYGVADFSAMLRWAAHQQSPGPALPPARETPKERLQRLMAAQLGKKIHQDAAAQALRRSQVMVHLRARGVG
ncbi:hypothetical protein F751_5056 [Auxenochlorella protothecoides]|uniref:Uncharacterized protein n=1 Tax=Auxenochlorella protothecoides TaxID=3075 RepID=A0A087SER0_AUXPR|nr:hypothetical protein F751_5056 [Auxenochlorella protothecoides]KFM24214.1 hypothetical protein F751_5056 [Auxenochlorella protothecoides]